ncbi:MAG: DUF1073 domain-containing protein [Acidiferrobacterales bacterium]|nr:DUF1073 domain-containing protein [Acidiferrobacterales bacterium]
MTRRNNQRRSKKSMAANNAEAQTNQSGLDLAVNHYLAANASGNTLRQQMALASIDTKHPQCWNDYGYPTAPCFSDFYTAYKRSGLGKAGIEVMVDKCWQSWPWVRTVEDRKSKPTAWEIAFDKLANRLDLWANCKMLDVRQKVGRYAGFLVVVADNKKWHEEITGGISPDAIKQIIPLYESQLEVEDTYQDENQPNYGLPKTYMYNESALGDTNPDSLRKVTVHESRVIIWAEGASGNSIYGTPDLEAGLNNLINIEKIDGAGGEGFYKNARTPINLELDEKASVQDLALMYDCKPEELASKISEKLKDMHQGFDNSFLMKGMKAAPMVAALPNPKEFLDSNKRSFAASVKTPLTILEGNQSGNQASQENGDTLDQQAESRRSNEIDRFIKRFIRWLEKHKVLKANEQYFIFWDSLLEPSKGEKLDNATKMIDGNQKALGTGVVYFTVDEVREAAGYEPLAPSESIREEDVEPEE